MAEWIVYGHEQCPWCVKVKELLSARGVPFSYVNVRENEWAKALLVDQGLKTVPQVFRDGLRIGGYEDVAQWLEVNR